MIDEKWRKATKEESEYFRNILKKEVKRSEINNKIGGLDERGNYTALHHRWSINGDDEIL